VDDEIGSFLRWNESLAATPTIVALRNKAEDIRKEELEKIFKKLGPMEEEKIRAIEYLSTSIVNKLIHPPTAALKSEEEDRDTMVEMAKKLFGLNEENNGKEE